jgi:hypothetical protein
LRRTAGRRAEDGTRLYRMNDRYFMSADAACAARHVL